MDEKKVYDIVIAEIEKNRQYYDSSLKSIYIGKKIHRILKKYNNDFIVNVVAKYKTFMGMEILDKPRYGCIMIRDSLINNT